MGGTRLGMITALRNVRELCGSTVSIISPSLGIKLSNPGWTSVQLKLHSPNVQMEIVGCSDFNRHLRLVKSPQPGRSRRCPSESRNRIISNMLSEFFSLRPRAISSLTRNGYDTDGSPCSSSDPGRLCSRISVIGVMIHTSHAAVTVRVHGFESPASCGRPPVNDRVQTEQT